MLHFFARRITELHEKDRKGEKGFTLIELLVVVIIIGILAAIAIPTFLNQRRNAWEAQTKSDIRNSVTNVESNATSNNGSYAGTTTAVAVANGTDKNSTITVPAGSVSATGYCVQGVNKTDSSVTFHYLKSADAIAAGNCP